jgi:opacity protein-like surface antigen
MKRAIFIVSVLFTLTSATAHAQDTAINTDPAEGCYVAGVTAGTAAEKAGLQKGDVIVEAGGKKIRIFDDLEAAVKSAPQEFPLVIQRGGSTQSLTVSLPHVKLRGPRLGVQCKLSQADVQAELRETIPAPRHFLFAGLGATLPLSDIDFQGGSNVSEPLGEVGPGGGLQYLYVPANSKWGFGVDMLYHGFSPSETDELLGVHSEFKFKSLMTLAVVRRSFLVTRRMAPYVFLGLGLSSNRLKWEITPPPGTLWSNTGTNETRDLTDDSDIGFASAIGLGMDLKISDRWLAGVEVRLANTGDGTYEPTTLGQSTLTGSFDGNIRIFTGLFRVGYRLGSLVAATSPPPPIPTSTPLAPPPSSPTPEAM